MSRALAYRLLGSLASILAATLVAFVVLRVLPGDPAREYYGRFATPQQLAALRRQMGLEQPMYQQYWIFVSSLARGDWGYSFSFGQPVIQVIGPKVMASIELALSAFVFAVMSALSLALVSVRYRGSWIDGFGRGIALVALGIPVFWLGLLLLLVFSVHAGVTPGPEGQLSASTAPPPSVTGFVTVDALIAGQWFTFADAAWHLILPTIALALAPAAYMFRLLRSSMLETSREPFLIVVRSKGLSRWQATRRHILPNALLPVVTASGLILAELLTGAVLVETVFAWPGMGALFTDSIVKKDYGVAQIIIVLIALSYVVINAGVDVLYGVLDPRIRRANPGA